VKVRYFAWMRQTVGVSEEDVEAPADAVTIRDLLKTLRARGPGHAEALAEGQVFGAALDSRVTPLDTPLGAAREVAFFPPFTGG
jgi:molybdopterin synthase sulfur carrier subunit